MQRLGYLSVWSGIFFLFVAFPGVVCMLFLGGVIEVEWELLSFGGISLSVGGSLDYLSTVFGGCVLFISSSVFMFGQGYMVGGKYMARFVGLLVAFVLSMGLFIFSSGLISLLLGWDGLGLSSFLLVIYYQGTASAGGGLITVLSNRVGDVALILGLSALLFRGDFSFFGQIFGLFSVGMVVLGAITKSAQFPFSAWLPLAMAAPTPVSALVHSSTLVTAGVYMLIRCYSVVGGGSGVCSVMMVLGSVTALAAGLAAISECDGKKVVAFSTLSQLGLMFVSLGLGAPLVAFFHLLTHAMFKALLFVCIGCFIYFYNHTQDLRGLGNVVSSFPIARTGMLVASGALCGVPFLAGFYSKDLILEMGLVMGFGWGFLFSLIGATALTSVYSIRGFLLMQLVEGSQACLGGSGDKSWEFWWAVGVLEGGAVCGGAGLNWILLPSIGVGPISGVSCSIPLLLILGGSVFGSIWKEGVIWFEQSGWSGVFSGLWFLSDITCQYSIKVPLLVGSGFLAVVDQGWLELSSSGGMGLSVQQVNQQVRVISEQPVITIMMLGFMGMIFPMVCYIV